MRHEDKVNGYIKLEKSLIYWNFPGGTEETQDNSQPVQPLARSTFEARISGIQVWIINAALT